MSQRVEIESWVKGQFSVLADYGFSEPVIKRKSWSTGFDWLGKDIAIELELDWREFNAFLLVVRLEDDQLPQGYYVSNGQPCRVHLQKIIKEKGWSITLDDMDIISYGGKRKRSKKPSADILKERILAYNTVLMSCINRLVADGRTIFK